MNLNFLLELRLWMDTIQHFIILGIVISAIGFSLIGGQLANHNLTYAALNCIMFGSKLNYAYIDDTMHPIYQSKSCTGYTPIDRNPIYRKVPLIYNTVTFASFVQN